MVGRKHVLAASLCLLGIGLVLMGFSQLNQYLTTTSALQNLGSIEGADASLGAAFAQVSGSFITSMAIDFLLGIILLVVGLFLYPDKHD